MILTISGAPGTGKTSVAKLLAAKLGLKFYSIGDLRGKMALERGITIDELNTIGESDSITDVPVDEYQRELGMKEDNFVIEGRLSWHFIPHATKIYLTCDPDEAARRIFSARQRSNEGRGDEPAYASVEDVKKSVEQRVASDVLRYEKYYHVDYRDPSHYDIVMDTTAKTSAEETAAAILSELRQKAESAS